MKQLKPFVRAAFLLGILLSSAAHSARMVDKDLSGAKDHPMVSRYAGSVIIGYKQSKFDETELVLGPAYLRDGKRGFVKTQRVEGAVTDIVYVAPRGRSSLEVMRNYESALAQAGFAKLYTCAKKECGDKLTDTLYTFGPKRIKNNQVSEYAFSMSAQEERLTTFKLTRAAGDVYVTVMTAFQDNAASDDASQRVAAFLEVVETKPMEGAMVTVKAAAMQKGISAEGRVAIYGIYFDTDKADIKPASKAQLDEMAQLLKNNPKLNVFIVGHTDNQGGLDHNLILSQRRAEAVVKALVSQYGIAAPRLTAKGVANLAPVASNAGEAGRAKNRRVELVER